MVLLKAKKDLTDTENLRIRVHEANIAVHRVEVSYYELFHPEVYNKSEQRRIVAAINKATSLIADNKKKALDFGAGTGNLTEKLLALGYEVTAVDISPEMCQLLRRKFKSYIDNMKLKVVNSPIEDVVFGSEKFDLVCCYSVLHHLPNYEEALLKLCGILKKRGVMYIDHEASPYYWKTEPAMLADLLKGTYRHSIPIFNSLFFRLIGFNVPNLDYTLSDYWHKKKHALDHKKIAQIFVEENFGYAYRTDYYLRGTWIYNPLLSVYKLICHPEMSYWIAKK